MKIVEDSVMEELVKAEVKTFVHSDEGREFIEKTFDDEARNYFSDWHSFGRSFGSYFDKIINEKVAEFFKVKSSYELIPNIILLGLKQMMKESGYKVTIEEIKK